MGDKINNTNKVMDYKSLLWIFLGGGIGSSIRYLISVSSKQLNSFFPLGTLFANLLGCLLIGLLVGYLSRINILREEINLFFVVGFCGGLTTFSSFALDLVNLTKETSLIYPLLYFIANVLMGIIFLLIGLWIVR